MSSRHYKLLARIQLKRQLLLSVSITAIYLFFYSLYTLYINYIVSNAATIRALLIPFFVSLLFTLISDVFIVGLYRFYLLQAEKKEGQFSDLLYGIKHGPDRIIGFSLIKLVFTRLPFLPGLIFIGLYYFNGCKEELFVAVGVFLLMIGGVIGYVLSLGLSQCLLIAADGSEDSAVLIAKKSLSLMKGRKETFFFLQISFLPVFFLSAMTCYLGFFITVPYYLATTAYFYLDRTHRIRPYMFFTD